MVSGKVLLGTVFRQGNRYFFLTPLRFSMLDEIVQTGDRGRAKNANSRHRKLNKMANRPEDRNHTKAIQGYLEENCEADYILPPITLNVPSTASVSLFLRESSMHHAMAVLVIPAWVRLLVTDGQHRVNAINDTLDYLDGTEPGEQLKQDHIGVMITFESKLIQVHQDFADCSRTKQLSPSQISVYDQRNAANSVVIELEKMCPIFTGHVDASGKSVSKDETNRIWIVNWLRQMIKGLLFSGVNMSSEKFEEAADRNSTPRSRPKNTERAAMFVNYLTSCLTPWKEMLAAWELPADDPECRK